MRCFLLLRLFLIPNRRMRHIHMLPLLQMMYFLHSSLLCLLCLRGRYMRNICCYLCYPFAFTISPPAPRIYDFYSFCSVFGYYISIVPDLSCAYSVYCLFLFSFLFRHMRMILLFLLHLLYSEYYIHILLA